MITEYQTRFEDQEDNFAAEIVFFETTMRENITRGYFADYYSHNFEEHNDLDQDESDSQGLGPDTAAKTSMALLTDHD